MCFKFKHLSRYAVNGSTLIAFGLAVLSLAYTLWDNGHPILANIIAVCSMWFGFWGAYEFIFVGLFSRRPFFEDEGGNSNKGSDKKNHKKTRNRK